MNATNSSAVVSAVEYGDLGGFLAGSLARYKKFAVYA